MCAPVRRTACIIWVMDETPYQDTSGKRTLQSLLVRNLLSFGEEPTTVELEHLNVLIGPNGSGKSNFIEVLGLLQNAPKELATALVWMRRSSRTWILLGLTLIP